jgi:hypothetical protein
VRLHYVMVVDPSFPAKTVAEFIAYAKANPGKLSGLAGQRRTTHGQRAFQDDGRRRTWRGTRAADGRCTPFLRARFVECCCRGIMVAWHHGSKVEATD